MSLTPSSSRNSLKEYVRSIGAPSASKSNIFGLKAWIDGTRSGNQEAPLLENEDNFDDPETAGSPASGSGSWYSSSSSVLGLSKKQRVIGFMMCLCLGVICFTIAFFTVPFIMFKARKFATLFTLGSVFTMASFSLLWGPWNHLRHLCSRDRLPFTSVYLVSLGATLYCSLHLRSTPLTIVCAVCQLLALVWFTISYVPGGQRGLQFFSSLCSTAVRGTVSRTLPV